MMNRVLYILLMVLFAVGCKLGPNIQNVSVAQPEKYMNQGDFSTVSTDTILVDDSLMMVRWWEMFNDSILDTLIFKALENNQDVQIAASRVEESRAILGFTRADVYPRINYQAQISRANSIGALTFPSPQNNFLVGGSVNWEIDFWGKYRRANEAAKGELLASEFAHRSVQIGLISQVAIAYFQLLDYKLRLEISEKTFALRDSSLSIIKAKFDKGVVAEIDLNQSQVQKAIAEAAIPIFERNVVRSENALSVLLGENPKNIIVGKDLLEQNSSIELPLGLPSELLTRRPDVLLAEQKLYAQNARIGVAVAERFPSISLTGLFGGATSDLSNFNSLDAAWSVGGDLLGPLFYFNKRKRKVEVEKARTQQMLLSYEKAVIVAFQEVEDALVTISTLKDELKARNDHVKAAVNAQMLSQRRYDGGVTSYLELLEMQRQAFEAELSQAETFQKLLSAYVSLYKSLGGGWISPQEEIDVKTTK